MKPRMLHLIADNSQMIRQRIRMMNELVNNSQGLKMSYEDIQRLVKIEDELDMLTKQYPDLAA